MLGPYAVRMPHVVLDMYAACPMCNRELFVLVQILQYAIISHLNIGVKKKEKGGDRKNRNLKKMKKGPYMMCPNP